jgi:hypothetical protein
MVKVEFYFWKILVFLLVFIFILALISIYLNLKNIGFNELEQVVLRR